MKGVLRSSIAKFVVYWTNVTFHHSQIITQWYVVQPQIIVFYLPAYSPLFSILLKNYFQPGDREFTTTDQIQMNNSPSWKQLIQLF